MATKHTQQRRQQIIQAQNQFQEERTMTDRKRHLSLLSAAFHDTIDILVEQIFGPQAREKNISVAHNIIEKTQSKTQEYLKSLCPRYSPTRKDLTELHLFAQKDMVEYLIQYTKDSDRRPLKVIFSAHDKAEEYLHSLTEHSHSTR